MIDPQKRSPLTVSLSIALLLLTAVNVTGRDLSTITYHFSTCGSQGENGPTFEQCQNHYQSTNSLVSGILTEHVGFLGGQEFTFPRSGDYGIRIAGAAGGRGVCSIEGGQGVILSTEVYIEQGVNDTFLIVVGQRGTSPCDTNTNYDLCMDPPTSLEAADTCGNAWLIVDSGGAGGGGGSMLWPENAEGNYTNETLPLIAASGGGGTSAVLNYLSINSSTIPIGSQTDREYYINWINGQPVVQDGLISDDLTGSVGNQPIGNAAGFGSGWRIPSNVQVTFNERDGNLLSQNENFAIGGENCLAAGQDITFLNVTGGFGGGGGACSEGGGGGGYGGGWVLKNGNDVPGRGGYSLHAGLNVSKIEFNNGDGYVKIFPLDCGCSSGLCNIDNDSFACVCREGEMLAGNNFNCLTDKLLTSENIANEEISVLTISDRNFQVVLMTFDKDYELFGAMFQLEEESVTKREVEEEILSCIGVYIDNNGQPVLISTTNTDIGQSEGLVTINNGVFSSPIEFLEDGQTVSGIMSIGGDDCRIITSTIVLTVDADFTSNSSNPNIILNDTLTDSLNTFELIIADYLPSPAVTVSSPTIQSSSTPSSSLITPSLSLTISLSTSVDTSPTNMAENTSPISTTIIAIISVVSVLVVIIILSMTCLIVIVLRKRNSKRTIYQIHSRSNSTNGPLRRRGTLQRIKTRIMSLTSNPNYGETTIPNPNGEDFIDLAPKQIPEENSEKVNLYESVSLTNSLKRSSIAGLNHGRIGSKKDSASSGPFRLRSRSRRRTLTLKPKYGVTAPTIDFYKYNSKRSEDALWEYDRTQLTYLRDIGEGQFGKVLLMKAKNIAGFNGKLPVAVKTLSSIEEEDVTKFLEEVELMKKFCHPNIVSLLGVNSQYSEGAPLMILEYMPYGDLQSFLKRHKPKGNDSSLIGAYHHKKFARDVVLALNFLSKNRYVHRDVAARNCLVGPSLDVKLADFGMARGVHEKEYYRIAGRAVLPVRWMAPESLLYGMFSSSSDVWSYGVLLWEIVTYGDMPLETSTPQNIVDMAQMQTLSHDWPTNSTSEELMNIKDRCHAYEHEERITFDKIIELLPYSTDAPAGNT